MFSVISFMFIARFWIELDCSLEPFASKVESVHIPWSWMPEMR